MSRMGDSATKMGKAAQGQALWGLPSYNWLVLPHASLTAPRPCAREEMRKWGSALWVERASVQERVPAHARACEQGPCPGDPRMG